MDYVLVFIRLWHTVLFCCKRCGAVKEMPSLLIFNVQFFIFSRYSDTCTGELSWEFGSREKFGEKGIIV